MSNNFWWSNLPSITNLGRAKESSVRNLTLILLKRVFKDENGISPELVNRISASLGAIERISPEIYSDVMENKFGSMLSTATDIQLMRVFPFLITRDVWENIDNAEKVRVEGLVQSMTVDDLIKYGVTKLAELNYEIKSNLSPVIQQFDNLQKYNLFSSHPSKIFKKEAIDLFADSRSFDSAELRGANILIPIAKHFNDDDFNQIFEGSLNNKGSYGHNQILYAGAIDSFFTNLYQESKISDADHKKIWKEFRDKLEERKVNYASLDELLIADQIIEKQEEEEEVAIPEF